MPPRSYSRRTTARHCSLGNACRSTTAGIVPAASASNGRATRASTSSGVPSIGDHVIAAFLTIRVLNLPALCSAQKFRDHLALREDLDRTAIAGMVFLVPLDAQAVVDRGRQVAWGDG